MTPHVYERSVFKDLEEGDVFVLERRNRQGEVSLYRKVSAGEAAVIGAGERIELPPEKVVFRNLELSRSAYERVHFSDLEEGDVFSLERRSRGGSVLLYRKRSDGSAFPLSSDSPPLEVLPEKVVFKKVALETER